MDLKYFDIHSHLYFPDYDIDREEEINKIKKAGIGTITIGTDFLSSKLAIDLAEKNEYFFASVGDHPGYTKPNSIFDEHIGELAKHPKVVALGECGLDYFRLEEDKEIIKKVQKNIFEEHIKLSLEIEKPLMLHIRSSKDGVDAYIDTLEILESHYKTEGEKLKGNAHFFAGNMEILKRFLDIGFSVSFTGVITFTRNYDEYIRYAPIKKIMSETDAPFVAPIPYRGKRNSPLFVPEIVKKIAEIKEEDFENVRHNLLQNAINFFKLNP
jgi:TatD DNase family protein